MARSYPLPQLRPHVSGQGVVKIRGKDHYLGPYNDPETRNRYDRLIAEYVANGRNPIGSTPGVHGTDITVNRLVLAWLKHAKEYYRDSAGEITQEPEQLQIASRPLCRLYGKTPAREFSPLKLKAVRKDMVDSGLSRPEINRRVGRILRAFRWGASEELVPEAILASLKTVEPLKKNRSEAKEPPPVGRVDLAVIEATLPYLTAPLRAVVGLLVATGARTKEICHLRTGDVDTAGDVWRYIPGRHKNDYRGRQRTIYIGPKGQAILEPWLNPDDPGAFVFSPRVAMEMRWADQRARRKTRVQPSQQARKKEDPKRKPGEKYQTRTVQKSISAAVKRANQEREAAGLPELPHWHPLQVRHTTGTLIRKHHGVEAAQVILGHAKADVTQVYAERDEDKALEVIRKVG